MSVQHDGVNWVHEDPITKSKRVTDVSGNIVSAIETDPWGADTNRSAAAAFQPRKYTTYDRDGNGSDEAMFRRYNRKHSRFDQPDPYSGSYSLADPQSLNRYSYTRNDPANFSDPTGLDSGPPDCGPGTVAKKDKKGDWQCVGTGVSVVTVTGSWDDMSDYLPNRTSNDLFMLVTLLGGELQNPSSTPPAQPLPPNYRPPKLLEQPCIDRTNDVRRDISAIAKTLHGKAGALTQPNKPFPGAQIDPGGQSFGKVVNTLYKNGYSENYSLDHPEGWGFQKKFNDGLWYHVIVEFPKGTDTDLFGNLQLNQRAPTPQITAHCHATNPNGAAHIIDRIFGP